MASWEFDYCIKKRLLIRKRQSMNTGLHAIWFVMCSRRLQLFQIKWLTLVPNWQSSSADCRSEMNFVRRSAAIVLCAIISASIASDGVFNAEGCGPNYYGDLIRRPPIGRLMEFPWLARLGYRKSDDSVEYLFQGTLIHPYYVVTSVFAAGYNQNSL